MLVHLSHEVHLQISCISGLDGAVVTCRFLTLVDVLYEHNIRLFCSSEGLPFELFQHVVTRSEARESKNAEVKMHHAV